MAVGICFAMVAAVLCSCAIHRSFPIVRLGIIASFLVKGSAFLAAVPAVAGFINRSLTATTSNLVTYLAAPVWCAALFVVVGLWRRGTVSSESVVRAFLCSLIGMSILAILWFATPRVTVSEGCSARIARYPAGAALVLTYDAILMAGLVALMIVCVGHRRTTGNDEEGVRTALQLIIAGVRLYIVFAALQAVKTIFALGGFTYGPLQYITAPLTMVAIALVAAGFGFPELRHWIALFCFRIQTRTAIIGLLPLWRDLAGPAAGTGSEPPTLRDAPPDVRLYRMAVEIHDGLKVLAPFMPAEPFSCVEEGRRASEFAAQIDVAVRARTMAFSSEGEVGFATVNLGPSGDFYSDLQWLKGVARHYRQMQREKFGRNHAHTR